MTLQEVLTIQSLSYLPATEMKSGNHQSLLLMCSDSAGSKYLEPPSLKKSSVKLGSLGWVHSSL
ncbi:hypothetical protein A979_17564 [Pseudomonas syringae BRIP34876]|nr:hypothetical protein A979_17564 [Pseudomonas syringae BRIP34876]ELQ02524.1 hypothetical protein A987_12292 [Pseudomonas syringae BRIP34881]